MLDYVMNFKKTVLNHGIRVVTEQQTWANTIHIGLFVESGTKHELEGQMGMAHLTEHMVFKGTEDNSALDIVLNIEKVGGEINAHTSREYTCYTVQTLRKGFDLGLKTLFDLVFNATFPESDFTREIEVVQQEIDMSKDNLEDCIFDLYFERSFKGHILSRNILGTKESLSNISREMLLKYYQESYKNSKIILAVSGAISHDEVLQSIQQQGLDQYVKTSDSTDYVDPLILPQLEHHSDYDWIHKNSEQTHMVVGLPSVAFIDDFRFESYILSAALGGGMTSCLYQIIREDKGWAYSVYSYLQSFLEGGSLAIYVGTSADKVLPIAKIINEELRRLKLKGLSPDELDLYKTQVVSSILMGADDLESRMNSIGVNEMVFGKYRSVEDVLADISKVTLGSLNEYIEANLRSKDSSLLVMGEGSKEQQKEIKNFRFDF